MEIPGYTVIRELGRGGMATVYLAIQESLGREVALKILSASQDPSAGERFLREARIAASLHHPNIVPIHDFGVHAGTPYIAMHFEPGGSMLPLSGERLEPRAALRSVREIACALEYAHGRGVVHRDIKPDNILRGEDGAAMLSDFGIARLVGDTAVLTAEGTSVGTPHYMSPEQLRGDKVDGRSDLYSLGVVLWQLLTGELPFAGKDGWAIGTQHLTADIPRLPPDLAHLQALVDSLLAKRVAARMQSGAEVVARIDALLATSATPATMLLQCAPKTPPPPIARPGFRGVGLVALATLALAIVSLAWRQFGHDAAVAPPLAARPSASAPAPGSESPKLKSIAVLPFVNMSDDPGNQYFSDGISEELLNVLARVEQIGVASRTSSFAYRGRDIGAVAIARELKVDFILEGSVRKAGKRVRITAQLIDARSDRHLWSHTYDRQIIDIFAIQEEIANTIVAALRGSLVPQRLVTVRADTHDPQAYDLYLKARELFLARTDLAESTRLFERSVQIDPKFARGWEGLAAVAVIAESWDLHDRDYDAIARRAAERALALDASLSTAWGVLGALEDRQRPVNWNKAMQLMNRSIAADPRNATAFLWRGLLWVSLGHFDRALVDLDRCLALDPAYQNCKRQKALSLLFAGETARAVQLFDEGLASGFARGRAGSFIPILAQRGDGQAAKALLETLGAKAVLREAAVAAFRAPHGSVVPAGLKRYLSDPTDPFAAGIAPLRRQMWLHDYRGQALDDEGEDLLLIAWEPFPPDFRNSPEFKRLLEHMGVPAYWRQHGFPPQCRPLGRADFRCD